MVDVKVTYIDGKTEIFKDINEDTIEVKNGILSFDGYYLDTYKLNFAQVRRYKTSI